MRTPPRVPRYLLERLPHEHREHVIGDLLQEYHRLADAGAPIRASVWMWRETLALVWSLGLKWPRLLGDLRLAARTLRRSPTFVVLSSGTLALGIGAMTAIFSIVDPLIIRPLPFANPQRLLLVSERESDGLPSTTGYATYADIKDQSRTLESIAVTSLWIPVLGYTDPERITGGRVTASYFPTLGVQPVLGRNFTSDEDQPGHNHVVLLSNGLWRRRFGADSMIVGRTIAINAVPYTVVGILPATYDDVIWPAAEIWSPLGYDLTVPMACRTCRHLQMIARMRPQVTPATARTELNAISARIVANHPKDYSASGMLIDPLQLAVTRSYRPALIAIGGAVLLLLLIAIANVTGLQLARGLRRRGEFALRTALGAQSSDLAQQLLAESLIIAVLGGLGGLAVTWAGLPALVRLLPAGMPRVDAIHVDAVAFVVAALVILAIGVAIGLVTSSHGTSSSLRLKASSHERRATRIALVIGEFAMALMLLVSAGLIGRSLVRLLAVNVGFDPDHVLSLAMSAVGPAYKPPDAIYAYHDRVLAAVRATPGVQHAALATAVPLAGNLEQYTVEAQDKPLANPELAPIADRYVVSSDFFQTMHIPLLRGRALEAADFADSATKVVVVSRTLATALWPGEDPVGKRVKISDTWWTVVGMVGDIRHESLEAQGAGQFYAPERQWPWADGGVALDVRVAGDPAAIAPTLRQVLAAIDPSQPISRVETMQQIVVRAAAQQRVAMVLFAAFAAFALILAAGGIYGVLASSVAERTREIGVRSALGATPGQILRMFVTQGARLAGVGTVLGLIGVVALTRFLRTLLFGIEPTDPVTLLLVAATLAGVALAACLIPAMRAIRIEPVSALRSE